MKKPCGVLWEKKDAQGRMYLGGVLNLGLLGEIPVVIFKETEKKNPMSPDYIVRVARKNEE